MKLLKLLFIFLVFVSLAGVLYLNHNSFFKNRGLASETTHVDSGIAPEGEEENICFNELEERALTPLQIWQSDVTFNSWMDAIKRAFVNPYSFDLNEFLSENDGDLSSRFAAGRALSRCEKYQVIKEKLREVNEATSYYKKQREDIVQMRESILVFLTIEDMPKKATCHKMCEINLRKEIGEKDCLKHCGFPDNQYVKQAFENIPGESDYIDYENCKNLTEYELEKLKQYYSQILIHLKRRKPQIVEALNQLLSAYKTDSISLPSEISNLKSHLERLGTTECKKQLGYNERVVRDATRSITSPGGEGTGFFAQAGNEQYFLSAQHVAVAESDGLTFPKFLSHRYLENGEKKFTQFSVKPGFYDRGRDIVAHRSNSAVDGLEMVGVDELPKVGQKFTSFGYPGSRQSQWSSYSCFFAGYYAHSEFTESNYLLRCPSMTKTLMGVSGGPLVDDQGRVWGVNRAEILSGNLIIVSPIHKNDQQLKIGIQQRRNVDHCFKDTGGSLTRHSCSIFPNNNIDTY